MCRCGSFGCSWVRASSSRGSASRGLRAARAFGVGLIERDVLLFDLFLIPLIPIGSYLGKYMHHRVSESQFNRVILVLTLLAGIQLISGINLVQVGYGWLFRGLG